jgi:hypothetical protein
MLFLIALQDPLAYALSNTMFFLSILLLRSLFVVCEVFAMASVLFLDVHGCCSLCYKQLLPHHPGLARAPDAKAATMEPGRIRGQAGVSHQRADQLLSQLRVLGLLVLFLLVHTDHPDQLLHVLVASERRSQARLCPQMLVLGQHI